MAASNKGSLVLGGLGAAIVSAGILFSAYQLAAEFFAEPSLAQLRHEREVMGTWPSAPGRLVKLTVFGIHISGSRGGHTEYGARGEYTYKVDGREYHGNRLDLDGSAYGAEYFSDQKNKLATLVPGLAVRGPGAGEHIDYSPNQLVLIHYDPGNPAVSILNNKDAKPQWWIWETGVPGYFWICYAMVGIGLAFTALDRFGRVVGLRPEPAPLRKTAGGKLIVDKGIPWQWLINIFGFLIAGTGATIVVVAVRPVPGESSGCTTLFLAPLGVIMALAGLGAGIIPKFRILIDPERKTIREDFGLAWIPFLTLTESLRTFDAFDRVEVLSKEPFKSSRVTTTVSLIPRSGTDPLELFSSYEVPASGGGAPYKMRELGLQVARVVGLHLFVNGTKEV